MGHTVVVTAVEAVAATVEDSEAVPLAVEVVTVEVSAEVSVEAVEAEAMEMDLKVASEAVVEVVVEMVVVIVAVVETVEAVEAVVAAATTVIKTATLLENALRHVKKVMEVTKTTVIRQNKMLFSDSNNQKTRTKKKKPCIA